METSKSYDVVVVGAGICGLNAAFAAAQRLGRNGRIALVERRERVGGMWNDTYDYVRLHQPHPMFTAGTIKWRWDKDPHHLSDKVEVLDHLQYCLETIAGMAHVDTFFGWGYAAHEEADGVVRTTIEREGETVVLESGWMVKALGFDVRTNDALAVSSSRVHSVSPDHYDVRTGDIAATDAPVWVVGSGKTGMDTALALMRSHPGREVNLLAGSGTYFWRRDETYAAGRPWRRGTRPIAVSEQLCAPLEPTSGADFFAQFLGGQLTTVTSQARSMRLGVISDAEVSELRAGLGQILNDHLVDVVDDPSGHGALLVLRSGERVPVPAGTWLVNCTGYLMKQPHAYEPFCSPSGRVLSVNQRSNVLFFSTFGGYYLTHLLLRDKLRDLPLFELDMEELESRTPVGLLLSMANLLYNFTWVAEALPPTVLLASRIDFDTWYPAPRRVAGALSFLARRRRIRARLEPLLQGVRDEYGVRCGPLPRDYLAGKVLA